MRRNRGFTLLETIVVSVVLVLLVTLGQYAIVSVMATSKNVSTLPPTQTDAVDIVNTIGAAVRRSFLCTSGGTVNAGVQSGTSTGIAVCTSGTAYANYYVDGSGNFGVATGALPVGTNGFTILKSGTVSLKFYYCLSNGSTYNVADTYSTTDPMSYPITTSNPAATWTSGGITWVNGATALTPTQMQQVMAVYIAATVTRNGSTVSYASVVRMRNSPVHSLQ